MSTSLTRRDLLASAGIVAATGLFVTSERWDVVTVLALAGFLLFFGLLTFSKPRFGLYALIVALPLEITKIYVPILVQKDIKGEAGSILDYARFMMAALVGWWLCEGIKKGALFLPRSKLSGSLFVYLAYACISGFILAADRGRGIVEAIRLCFFFLVFCSVVCVIRRDAVPGRYIGLFVCVMTCLAVIGISQYLFEYHLWIPQLGFKDDFRVNTTFVDPNHYARFLVAALVLLLVSIPHLGWSLLTVGLVAITLQMAIFFTFSRGGWISEMAAFPFVLYAYSRLFPRQFPRILKAAVGLTTLVLLLGLPLIWGRITSLGDGTAALGARIALLATGIQMFMDHKVFGAGLGSFQATALSYYRDLLPAGGEGVTYSHTSFVTIAAELGLVGLLLVGWVFKEVCTRVRTAWVNVPNRNVHTIAAGGAILVVVVAAQGEARLFEGPELWFFLALFEGSYLLSEGRGDMAT